MSSDPRQQTTPRKAPGPVVLQVVPALKDGGVETSAVEMSLYLKAHGWRPLVASAGGPKAGRLGEAGIPHIRVPLATKLPWGVVFNIFRLVGIIRREGVQLVHARSRAPAWSAWLASRLTGVPYVTTFHGTYGLGGGGLKRFYNSVMVRGPVVIANSRFIKAHIIENYDVRAENIVVAARGIEPAAWDPGHFTKNDIDAVRSELGVKKGVPVVLMVGRITRWKGHDLMLEAMGRLKHLPWVMVFAGGIDKESEYGRALLARAEALGISERVRWLGSRSDIARLLAASDLAVSASTRPEAFGRVAIEAMAMGVPVVATGIGGSLETIVDGKTGWLVKPQTKAGAVEGPMFGSFGPQAMAEKLGGALQNPGRLKRMGQAARAHVLATFTVDRCCAAELLAYERVLAETKRARTDATS